MGFQLLSGIYRTNEQNHTYDKAYTVSACGTVIKFHGLTSPPSRSCIKELHEWMRAQGYTAYEYERYKNNVKIIVTHKL